uniref:Uncharacterized protein n=1 Tax=Lepeophtheirus salmonis TaxID=72036 RepID=A0A0K2VIG8_LEPSM
MLITATGCVIGACTPPDIIKTQWHSLVRWNHRPI